MGGTEDNFARIMTQTARNLGMKNTTYRNASGLPNKEQMTTARDQAILAMHIMQDYPEYYSVFETMALRDSGMEFSQICSEIGDRKVALIERERKASYDGSK